MDHTNAVRRPSVDLRLSIGHTRSLVRRDGFAHRIAAVAVGCLLCLPPHHALAQDGQRRTHPPDMVETVVPALGLIGLVAMAYWKAYQALTGSRSP